MRVKLLQNVANDRRGDVVTVGAAQAERLITTGYAVEFIENKPTKKAEAA